MTPEQIEQVLGEHEFSRAAFIRETDEINWQRGVSICSCGATFVGAHRAHVAQVLASLMPQATETVEWAVSCPTVRRFDSEEDARADAADRQRHEHCPGRRVLSRTVTAYAPVVGPWEVVE